MLANLLPVGKLRGIDIGGASDVGNREKSEAAGNRKAREKRYKFITPTSADGDGPGLAFPQTLLQFCCCFCGCENTQQMSAPQPTRTAMEL